MKKYFLVFTLSLLISPAFSQVKKKAQEKPPTQKEMDAMMREAQSAMDDLDPETKKMMDSMGIKIPSFKNAPKINSQQLAQEWEKEELIVPKKDAGRIAAIPKKVTDANMKGYIMAVQKNASLLFSPGVITTGDKVKAFIKSNSKNASEAGNMACALWIAGKQELALYVLGTVCGDEPTNTDNVSNYAAMLSMQGGQHLAIPILNNLNKKYPKNSTLLNNLGQAWFGLGDILNAEKYLDSALRFFAAHPQANLTKAAIEKSRGNIVKAKAYLKKSIKHSYTDEKELKLRELGYEIELDDLGIPFKPDSDPLGLAKLKRPGYPISRDELKMMKPLWEKFDQEIDERLDILYNELKQVSEQLESATISRKINITTPVHIRKASLKLQEVQTFYEKKLERLVQKFSVLIEDLDKIKNGRKRAVPEAPCELHIQLANDYFKLYNERQKEYHDEFLDVLKRYINDMAYYSQFTVSDKTAFEMLVLENKIDWLKKIKEYRPLLYLETEDMECSEKEKATPNRGKLADFDVVACNYNDTMNLGIIAFYQNCSRMTSKLNLKFVEYTRYDNFERAEGDNFESSTLKISVEQGFDDLKTDYGPLKLEAKVGAAIELEFDRQGVKDVILSVEAKAGAGINGADEGLEAGGNIAGKDIVDTTVEVGVEGRVSIISGKGSVSGTGKLEGIRMLEW